MIVLNTYLKQVFNTMLTRSKAIASLLDIIIDFDEASAAWKSNKKSNGNGTYSYICTQYTKTGKPCCRKPLIYSDYCKIHTNNSKK